MNETTLAKALSKNCSIQDATEENNKYFLATDLIKHVTKHLVQKMEKVDEERLDIRVRTFEDKIHWLFILDYLKYNQFISAEYWKDIQNNRFW